MFEVIVIALFCWLFYTAIKLCFKLTFGMLKLAGLILCVIALPTFVGGLLFAGGMILLLPLILVGAACGLIKICAGDVQ